MFSIKRKKNRQPEKNHNRNVVQDYQKQKRRAKYQRQVEKKHLNAAKNPMDTPFLLLTLLLTAIGLVMLYSASFPYAYYKTGDSGYYFKRQLIFAVVGIVAMVVMARINYQRLRGAARMLLIISFILLILVIIPHNPLAITSNNATRWLGVGSLSFQPSEIAKLAVIIYFAETISRKREKMLDFRVGIIPYAVILGSIAILMMLEPHMSGTILILATGIILMVVGGMDIRLVVGGFGAAFFFAAFYIFGVSKGFLSYGAARIQMWKDPWIDATGDGYQMCQSLIAIGSGGLLGVGLGKSNQKFLYLPERQNDFIFAVTCEELGLIGAIVIMLIFALLILRGFWIALHARDRFGALLTVGIMTHMGLQTFLNIAVVTGLVPCTGISLPFFSYGGTALMLQLFEMGVVLSVSCQIPAPKEKTEKIETATQSAPKAVEATEMVDE